MGITGQYVAGVWLGNDDFTPMARVTGGSFPAQTWHNFMVQAHDTDNIAQIPGIAVHPVQAAEQAKIAAAAAQNAAVQPDPPPPVAPESVKDMSPATRQILEKLSSMLKDARPLTPSDTRPDRAEAVPAPGAVTTPTLAAAVKTGNAVDAPSAPTKPQTALSTGRDNNAATPQ